MPSQRERANVVIRIPEWLKSSEGVSYRIRKWDTSTSVLDGTSIVVEMYPGRRVSADLPRLWAGVGGWARDGALLQGQGWR